MTFEERDAVPLQPVPLQPGSLVCLPAGLAHRLEAALDSRMVVIYGARAEYTTIRPHPEPGVPGVRLPGEEPRS